MKCEDKKRACWEFEMWENSRNGRNWKYGFCWCQNFMFKWREQAIADMQKQILTRLVCWTNFCKSTHKISLKILLWEDQPSISSSKKFNSKIALWCRKSNWNLNFDLRSLSCERSALSTWTFSKNYLQHQAHQTQLKKISSSGRLLKSFTQLFINPTDYQRRLDFFESDAKSSISLYLKINCFGRLFAVAKQPFSMLFIQLVNMLENINKPGTQCRRSTQFVVNSFQSTKYSISFEQFTN